MPIIAVALNGWFGMIGLPHFDGVLALKNIAGRLLLSVMPGSWLGAEGSAFGNSHFSFGRDEHVLQSLDPSRVYGVMATPTFWIGALAGLALIAGAVYFRQRRIETSV